MIKLKEMLKAGTISPKDIAKNMIRPKRCGGGYAPGFCVECQEKKWTYEHRGRREPTWVCEDCRIAKGTYSRHCDDCEQLKLSKFPLHRLWHWWCSECRTPWTIKYMEGIMKRRVKIKRYDPNFEHSHEWPSDEARIRMVFSMHGYDLPLNDAEQLWWLVSDDWDASWLNLPKDDDELWDRMLGFWTEDERDSL